MEEISLQEADATIRSFFYSASRFSSEEACEAAGSSHQVLHIHRRPSSHS
ncbi:hypothetical protein OROHE_008130 [Orobanche hederae]